MPRTNHRTQLPHLAYANTAVPLECAPAPSDGPCPHRCNWPWRQAVDAHEKSLAAWIAAGCRGPEPEPVQVEPWYGRPVLCRRCTATVRGKLRELPLAYDALASVKYLTRTASADDERRGHADAPPSPSPGADHQDEVARLATGWEDALRRHLGHRAGTDRFGDVRATLAGAVGYLNTHYQALAEHGEWAGPFADQVAHAYATALAMVKNKPGRRHLPTPCPSPGCGVKALVQEEGIAGKPWCVECCEHLGGCGRLFAEHDWEWFARLLVNGDIAAHAGAA